MKREKDTGEGCSQCPQREDCPEYQLAMFLARALRGVVVQAAYDTGQVSAEEAQELLTTPLSPDDPSTTFDDRELLDLGPTELSA